MPHLVVQYTPNIDTGIEALCRLLLDTVLDVRDDQGRQIFPAGGMRVMAFPATHFSVGDGKGDYGFIYLNLKINPGRAPDILRKTGDSLMAAIRQHVEPVFARFPMGVTLHIEETPAALPGPTSLVYEASHNNLRAHLAK